MKWLCIAIVFTSCAQSHIVLYENGRPAATAFIQGDAKNITLRTRTAYFHADELLHSPATAEAGKVVASTTSYLSGLAALMRWIIPLMP